MRSRIAASGPAQGRWSLIQSRLPIALTPTQWSANITQQLLARHGVVMRETAIAEMIPGGYPTIYPALRTMEESGKIRRGMFVAGVGAAQFAVPPAVDTLRGLRVSPIPPEVVYLAATDPANPFGTLLPWPRAENDSAAAPPGRHAMARASGAGVILINGTLAAFLRRRNPALRVFLPEDEPDRTAFARRLAKKLAELAIRRQTSRSGLLVRAINDSTARAHFLAPFLKESGFVDTALGFQMRNARSIGAPTRDQDSIDDRDRRFA